MVELDPRLAEDTVEIGRFELCRLLLMNDTHWPWFILLPDRAGVTEIFQLDTADQQQLMRESSRLAQALTQAFQPDKLNIAALGNVVPQLHIHHIVRYRGDPAWPAPVWGKLPAARYSAEELQQVVGKLKSALPDATLYDSATDRRCNIS